MAKTSLVMSLRTVKPKMQTCKRVLDQNCELWGEDRRRGPEQFSSSTGFRF